MHKIARYGVLLVVLAMLAGGCAAAVVAGAGGTALWQHGKIVSEEPKPVEEVRSAAKEALKIKKIEVKDEVARDNFVQLRGEDKDTVKVAVDLVEVSKDATRIEIRVGVGQRQAARDLLLEIKKQLYEKPGFKLF